MDTQNSSLSIKKKENCPKPNNFNFKYIKGFNFNFQNLRVTTKQVIWKQKKMSNCF